VNDSLDELEEWCSNDRSGGTEDGGNQGGVIVVAP
jgi:hypothetical protein